jgi:hypothetical protein
MPELISPKGNSFADQPPTAPHIVISAEILNLNVSLLAKAEIRGRSHRMKQVQYVSGILNILKGRFS